MGIGMVVSTDHLIPVTDHGPTPLQVKRNALLIETQSSEIRPGQINDAVSQVLELRLLMQLPDPLKIAGPRTAIGGISRGFTAHGQQSLQLGCQGQGIESKLDCRDG